MQQIQSLIDSVQNGNSSNRLTLANVKGWLVEYLEMHNEEVERFPGESEKNHWDLIAADYDEAKDAMFMAAYFSDASVAFVSGHGNVNSVRAFAQDDFPESPEDVLDELARRFVTSNRLNVSLRELMAWLQQ